MASKGRSRPENPSAATTESAATEAGLPALAPMGAVLGVEDIERASRFYRALGFQQQFALPRADGRLTLAVLTYGSSSLLLGRRDELHYQHEARARRIRGGPHGLGVTLTLLVPDLELAYGAVQAAGLEVLLEPVEESYATGSSCSSTRTATSGRSRRRSNRSAWRRWPRSWPRVEAPARERAARLGPQD